MDSALDRVMSRLRLPSCHDHLCVDTAWHLEWLGVGMGCLLMDPESAMQLSSRDPGAQVPHIAEGTIRENIIFGAPFDEVCQKGSVVRQIYYKHKDN